MSGLLSARVNSPAVLDHRSNWLARWRALHAWVAACLLVASVVAVVIVRLLAPGARQVPVAVQVIALVTGVAVFGVPHGALDPLVGRHLLRSRYGARWWRPFYSAYLLLTGLVILGWWLAPGATLTAFLAASALHFGLGDVDRSRAPRGLAWAEVLARGAAPIVVPALAHPAAVREAFGWVAAGAAPGQILSLTAGAASIARWIVLPSCAGFALWHGIAAARHVRSPHPDPLGDAGEQVRHTVRVLNPHVADSLECLAVPALALAFPPFIAFLLYFALLHSARHAMALAASLNGHRAIRAWIAFARAAAPATVTTLIAGGGAWLVLRNGTLSAGPSAVRVLFAGLAALTAPHMLLTALAGEELDQQSAADLPERPRPIPRPFTDSVSGRRVTPTRPFLAPRPVQLVAQRSDRDPQQIRRPRPVSVRDRKRTLD